MIRTRYAAACVSTKGPGPESPPHLHTRPSPTTEQQITMLTKVVFALARLVRIGYSNEVGKLGFKIALLCTIHEENLRLRRL